VETSSRSCASTLRRVQFHILRGIFVQDGRRLGRAMIASGSSANVIGICRTRTHLYPKSGAHLPSCNPKDNEGDGPTLGQPHPWYRSSILTMSLESKCRSLSGSVQHKLAS
jgi:hypothetical protein